MREKSRLDFMLIGNKENSALGHNDTHQIKMSKFYKLLMIPLMIPYRYRYTY